MLGEDWPRESLDDLIAVPNDAGPALFIDLVAFSFEKMKVDRVVALEEFDVVTAALIREHLCLTGLSKLSSKNIQGQTFDGCAQSDGRNQCPGLCRTDKSDDVRSFMERVPAPWVIKPRSDVSAIGIRKVESVGTSLACNR
jgi:hypothetical protein